MEIVRATPQLVADVLDENEGRWIGFDIETTGLDPYEHQLVLLQFATRTHQYVIDVREWPDLTPLVEPFGRSRLVGHNIRFDLSFAATNGMGFPSEIFDTFIASQLVDGGVHLHARVLDPVGRIKRGKAVTVRYHSLGSVAHRLLGVVLDKEVQTVFVDDPRAPLTDQVLAYAAEDAGVLLPLADRLVKQIKERGLTAVTNIEMRSLFGLLWIDLNGIPLDKERWLELRDTAIVKRDAALNRLNEIAPGLNPRSPIQIKKILHDAGVMVPDTQEKTLKLFWDEHPVIGALLEYRDWHKKAATYGDGYLALINSVTGRVHVNYSQIGAESGRMSSSKKNIQNIPRAQEYRACFRPVPKEDGVRRVLIKSDYSQIEMRIMATVANDRAMLEIFEEGRDIYMETAVRVMGAEPTKENRQKAKPVDLGFIYGMGVDTFLIYARDQYGTIFTRPEAEAIRKQFFNVFKGVRKFHYNQQDGVVTVRTVSGRVRYGVEKFTEKVNTPVQGGGVDVLKLALALMWERREECPWIVPVACVHDEIVGEVDVEHADLAARWLRGIMLEAAHGLFPNTPMDVEAKIAIDWSGTPLPEE